MVTQEGCEGDPNLSADPIFSQCPHFIILVIQPSNNLDEMSISNINKFHLSSMIRVHNKMSQVDNWSKEEEKASDCKKIWLERKEKCRSWREKEISFKIESTKIGWSKSSTATFLLYKQNLKKEFRGWTSKLLKDSIKLKKQRDISKRRKNKLNSWKFNYKILLTPRYPKASNRLNLSS